MDDSQLSVRVNGTDVHRPVPGHRLLRDFVRDDLGLTGTKAGCEDGMCGACSLLIDGAVVKSCLVLTAEAAGSEITTIEGLATTDGLSPVQQAMIDKFGFQCGFCTPGFIMTITALLRSERVFDAVSARAALVGNICRCTGYSSIVDAFLAAQGMRDGVAGPGRPHPDQPPGDHAHG